MEEKAAEGNVSYFSEFSTEELEKKLKHRDEDERTLVHICAAAGKTELLELFLANPKGRALVNNGDEEGWTPLHSAASCGHVPAVSLLLAAGADVNAANSGGQRPVHYAASKGKIEVLKKLIAGRAEVDARDKTKSTPLHRAASQGRVDVIALLLDELDELAAADEGGDGGGGDGRGKRVRCDLEATNRRVDAENRTRRVGQTPLLVACEAGQNEAAVALAKRGANTRAEDAEGNSVATLAPKLVSVLRSIREGD